MHFLHHSTTTITTTHEDDDDDDDQFINNTSLFLTGASRYLYSIRCRDVFNQSSSSSRKKIKMDFYKQFPIDEFCCHLEFVGSCNGLIYIVHYNNCGIDDHDHLIWNPSTGELKELPQLKFSLNYPINHDKIIAYGFGYDHTMDDYKVIRVEYRYNHYEETFSRKINVYTLGSNSWRKKRVEITDYRYNTILNCSGVFVNGALHWIMESSRTYLFDIISFDIAKEEHGEIQLPDNLSNIYLSKRYSDLRVLNGYLCIFRTNGILSDDKEMDVWMMKDYGVKNSWTKLFTINMDQYLEDISQPGIFQLCDLKLLKYLKNGRILMVYQRKYIITYDLKKDKRSKSINYDVRKIKDDLFENVFVEGIYRESLVSLNSGKYLTVAGSRIKTLQKHKRDEEHRRKKKKRRSRTSTLHKHERDEEDQRRRKKKRRSRTSTLHKHERDEEHRRKKRKRRSRTSTLHKHERDEEDQRRKKKKRRI